MMNINININIITFIIPTIGRETLENTVNSLLELNNHNWKALILFDGIKNTFHFEDERIICLEIEKQGKIDIKNNAGMVRNIGFDYILNNNINTQFIGFVDDDDTLHPNYINNVLEENTVNNDVDLIIFRMMYKNKTYLPKKNDIKLKVKHFGISFVFKKSILIHENENKNKNKKENKINYFINHPYEDFLFLKNIFDKKYKIIISPYINYFIRTDYKECMNVLNVNLPRVLLNFS